ncbi:MAG: hypothetical protein R6X18_04025 [Chloroflexota bacterium]|jgi:hypothetical protein
MTPDSQKTLQVLEQIVKVVPVGTNLALLQLMWAMITGSFLSSRGAVHSALARSGFEAGEIRRSWRALRGGQWCIHELLQRFRRQVTQTGQWQSREYGGYCPLAVDTTAYWRPRLQGWPSKLYRQLAGKAMTGIGFGLIADMGQVGDRRLPLIRRIVRGQDTAESEMSLKERTVATAAELLQEDEVLLHDGGLSVAQLQAAGVKRFIVRLGSNCTARRSYLPSYKGKGRPPTRGELVRPLSRKWQDRTLSATPPDVMHTFVFEARAITACGWLDVMRADLSVADDHERYAIWFFADPLFKTPLVLGTNLPAAPEAIFGLYLDRWPVEQIPLVTKQLLGCQRQFVFTPTSCWRLGELALLVGNILTWLAVLLPPQPTGYWDRHPKKHPAGYAGSWRRQFFQRMSFLTGNFEKSGRRRTIYPRELLRIGGKSAFSRPDMAGLCPHF